MKYALAIAALLAGTNAFAAAAPKCADRIYAAGELVRMIQDRFLVGEVTRVDVAKSQLEFVDTQLACYEILRGDYCSAATQFVGIYVEGIKEESRFGMREATEVVRAELRAKEVQAVCEM